MRRRGVRSRQASVSLLCIEDNVQEINGVYYTSEGGEVSSLPGVYNQTQMVCERGVLELLANLCVGTTSL